MSSKKKKQKFMVLKFFSMLFGGCSGGYVEIRPFDIDYKIDFDNRSWIPVASKKKIARRIWDLRHGHLFFGVATRTYESKRRRKGTKEYLKELPAFFADLDASEYQSWEEMEEILNDFPFEPSCLVFSGHGLHVYYFLDPPIKVEDNINKIERILKVIQDKMLKADSTSDLSRVLRAVSSINVKIPEKPQLTKILRLKDITYTIEDFKDQFWHLIQQNQSSSCAEDRNVTRSVEERNGKIDISSLKVSGKIKTLIRKGNSTKEYSYPSRSEADMAVIVGLTSAGYNAQTVKKIFEENPEGIGEKYHEKSSSKNKYLKHSINSAREFLSTNGGG